MKLCPKCRISTAGFRNYCLVCGSLLPLEPLEKSLRITIVNGVNRIIMVNQEVQ